MDEYEDLKGKDSEFSSKKLSKKEENIKIVDLYNFEDNLNISNIKGEFQKLENEKEKESPRKKEFSLKLNIRDNVDKDFSMDLDNINEDEFNERKISICSLQSEEFNCNIINNNNDNNRKMSLFCKKKPKKLTKADLNYIPLPVFSCIYCSNDEISYKHLSQEMISNKYLFQTSIFDIIQLNKLIAEQPIIDKDIKNEKLISLILRNTEFLRKYNSKENSYEFFKSNNYIDMTNKELIKTKNIFLSGIEGSVIKKKIDFYFMGINKIPKNSLNNKCLFNSTNSLINNYNAFSGLVETIPINNNININNGKINNNISNISINFNSISSNNNEIGNLGKDNNNLLVSVVEKIEKTIESVNEIDDKEEIMDFFKFDTERKIKKDDIIWDNNEYNIWNPNISDDEILKKEENNKIRKLKIKVNLLKSKDKLKIKTSSNSFIYKIKKNINASQVKSFISTNNSSVNNENDIKMKSNFLNNINESNNNSNSKYYTNNNKIKVNENSSYMKEKKCYSKNNKSFLSNKINGILDKIKINYKIRAFNSNKTKNINNYSKNKIHDFYLYNLNSQKKDNNKINSILKNKTFSVYKIRIKEDYKKIKDKKSTIKKYIQRKLNFFSSYENKSNNSSIIYKAPLTNRGNRSHYSNSRNEGTMITSSKMKFIQNNKFLNSFNTDYKKTIKTSPKKLNLSSYTSNHYKKNSFNKKKLKSFLTTQINKKSSDIKKEISNFNYSKINKSMVIPNKINKIKIIKNNIGKDIAFRRNIYNTKFNINSKTKIYTNKKIIFPTSFINSSTSKVVAIKKINISHFKK